MRHPCLVIFYTHRSMCHSSWWKKKCACHACHSSWLTENIHVMFVTASPWLEWKRQAIFAIIVQNFSKIHWKQSHENALHICHPWKSAVWLLLKYPNIPNVIQESKCHCDSQYLVISFADHCMLCMKSNLFCLDVCKVYINVWYVCSTKDIFISFTYVIHDDELLMLMILKLYNLSFKKNSMHKLYMCTNLY